MRFFSTTLMTPGTVSCGKLGGGEVYRINDCKLISLRGYSPDEEIGKVMAVSVDS